MKDARLHSVMKNANALKYAFTGSEYKVDISGQIDVQTLNGLPEQIFIIRTDFLILPKYEISSSRPKLAFLLK